MKKLKGETMMKKTTLAIVLNIMLAFTVNVQAGINVTVDTSKIYSTAISLGGSDTATVWMGYVNVTVTSGGSPYGNANIRAVSRGENVSSVETTRASDGIALLPILTDSPPPFIEIWVKDTSDNWINPESIAPIIDPSVPPAPPPPAAAAGGAAPPPVITPPPTPVVTPTQTPAPTAAPASLAPALAPSASGTAAEENAVLVPSSVASKKYVSTIKILNLTKEEWSMAGIVVAVEMLTVAVIMGRRRK